MGSIRNGMRTTHDQTGPNVTSQVNVQFWMSRMTKPHPCSIVPVALIALTWGCACVPDKQIASRLDGIRGPGARELRLSIREPNGKLTTCDVQFDMEQRRFWLHFRSGADDEQLTMVTYTDRTSSVWLANTQGKGRSTIGVGPLKSLLGGLSATTRGLTRIVKCVMFDSPRHFSFRALADGTSMLITAAKPEVILVFGKDGQLTGCNYLGRYADIDVVPDPVPKWNSTFGTGR